jgi:hypothetical protein
MITPHSSTSRDGRASVVEVKTRRTQAAATERETYGADNLPILIRLPDLTATWVPGVTTPVPVVSDAPTTKADVSSDGSEEAAVDAPRCEPVAAAGRDDASPACTVERTRRGVPRPAPARPSGGIGQFLFAVVLAGVLFAIIVTVKEWNQPPVTKTRRTGHEQVGAPDIHFAEPAQAPVPNVFSEQPELVPAANAFSSQPAMPRDTAFETSEPVAPEAAGYADGAEQEQGSGSLSGYPSTGVDAVQPTSASSAAAGGWPPAVDNRPIRNAERSSPDARYQQR